MLGIFDSGIGGLTVVKELLRQIPSASFIYLGDTARTPYGNKSPETVTRYSLEIAEFLIEKGATALIIACNTASATATSALRAAYPSIPVYEVIAPAVEEAISITRERIGVIGTRVTISSGAYEHRLKESGAKEVFVQACPLFVPLVEEGWLEEGETKRIVRRYLSPLRQRQVKAMIMGCTHYPLLEGLISRYMGKRVKLVNSARAMVSKINQEMNVSAHVGRQEYYLTDLSSRSEEIARRWLGRPIRFERTDLS